MGGAKDEKERKMKRKEMMTGQEMHFSLCYTQPIDMCVPCLHSQPCL